MTVRELLLEYLYLVKDSSHLKNGAKYLLKAWENTVTNRQIRSSIDIIQQIADALEKVCN